MCCDNIKFQVATVEVVGTQCFDVCIEFGPRIAVCFGVPVEPAPIVQVQQTFERAFGENPVAHDADLADSGWRTFGDGEVHIDTVALQWCDGGHHLCTVQTPAQVLALEFLFGTIRQASVERLPLANTAVAQGLDQYILVKFLQARELNARDHRTLFDDDNDHAFVNVDTHILEQTRGKQSPQARSALLVAVGVADTKRQGCKNGTGIGALQAFDTYVAQGEGLDSPSAA